MPITLRPFFTSSLVTAAPMPELAPVTMATRPDQRCIVVRCLQAVEDEWTLIYTLSRTCKNGVSRIFSVIELPTWLTTGIILSWYDVTNYSDNLFQCWRIFLKWLIGCWYLVDVVVHNRIRGIFERVRWDKDCRVFTDHKRPLVIVCHPTSFPHLTMQL
jgi:hypothetical protein